MNRAIIRKLLLAEAATTAASSASTDNRVQSGGKKRKGIWKEKGKKAKSEASKGTLSLMSKPPISKAKKMKIAAKKAMRRHQGVKESAGNALDKQTNQQLKGSQYVVSSADSWSFVNLSYVLYMNVCENL